MILEEVTFTLQSFIPRQPGTKTGAMGTLGWTIRHQSRQQAFELIRRVAWEGDKITQLNALESLAKIAHGIGLKDFPRLQRAGYSPKN